ncbi:DUF2946 domain-containing protein [Pigmentiphaga aceris]|uniref:DUF2946 domain-containing protein n=1 Tax=Pigmentiphaga aceris TaxID=1940612 RepID=A0A5C0B136_9BURK|nr:DUF2946 family protein [Pigmentiphaga aceris]QEI07686.1 DUF2946 domain-containing protein [Pigmentiphaga aceris]
MLADRILRMSPIRAWLRTPRPAYAVRQYLLGLALLAFVLRALMPMGFMPGMDAHHGNQVVLMLCNPAGVETAFVLDIGDSHAQADAASTQDDQGMSMQNCPFCMATSQAMLPTADIVLHVASLATSDVPVAVYVGPSPITAQGPPLGSRAPPAHLG